jgi:hypothetical protein
VKLLLAEVDQSDTTVEVLNALVAANSYISAVSVFPYRHPSLLQARVDLNTDERAILEKAMAMRTALAMPFWEALMLSCFGEKRDYKRLLREATFHQSHRDAMQRVSRSDILGGVLTKLAETQPPGEHLSFSSLIEIDKTSLRHLPLLDFHCPETPENDDLVSEVCQQLIHSSSILFSSGESYHALGLEVLDEVSFREFMTKSLLFAPIIDSRYVAHQLLEGACALRLSCSLKKPTEPRLKRVVEIRSDR